MELSRPQENQDGVCGANQPHDCHDAEYQPHRRGSDFECLPQRQIRGQRSEQHSDQGHGVGLPYYLDVRFFQRIGISRRRERLRCRLRCGRCAVSFRQPNRQVGANQRAAVQGDRSYLAARNISRTLQPGCNCGDASSGLSEILHRQK